MQKQWEEDNCAAMRAQYAVYSVPHASALWCGVPPEQVNDIVREATQTSQSGPGRSIWFHPQVPCLEVRSRAITEAIEMGVLPHGREDGSPVAPDDHVKYERRHVLGRDLRAWIEKKFPNEKPAFLFDEIERHSHTSISTEAYNALLADNKALKLRIKTKEDDHKKILNEKNDLEQLNQSLEAAIAKMGNPSERAESTYLNIIGAMLELFLSESPGGQAHSIFSNQSAVIQALLGYHEGKQGISARTLEEKFAAAKRSLNSN
jgi:hypothetical protein